MCVCVCVVPALVQPNTDDEQALARHQAASEEQFASVLRMRSCDVQLAVTRASRLAMFMVSHVAGLLPDPKEEVEECVTAHTAALLASRGGVGDCRR